MASMRAIRAGARAPVTRAPRRHDRCHHDADPMATARRGPWRDAHRWALAQAVARSALDPQKIGACDRPIAAPLGTFAERHARQSWRSVGRPRKWTRHRPHVDGRGARPRLTGVDLSALEGIDEPTAVPSLSAIGRARGRGPTVKPCTSWLGLWPHHRVSGGQG